MKSLKEYLTESKKTYSFKIKVAGPLPENFQETVKTKLSKFGCSKLEQVKSTPIQAAPLDFPEMSNVEITVFEAECSYPVTAPEIAEVIRTNVKISETCLRVRNSGDADEREIDDSAENEKKSKKALLDDSEYKEAVKVNTKEFFGDEFNTKFLKDLHKIAKQRRKDLGQKDIKSEADSTGPDVGEKSTSPLSSVQGN